MDLKQRFDKKWVLEPKTGCWLWIASTNQKGYGMIKVNGSMRSAHRIAWTIYRGNIPVGLQVCHVCDNPSCVMPEHLFLGTPSDNTTDCVLKGRDNWSKLTVQDVGNIRSMRDAGIRVVDIAAKYAVTTDSIYNVIKGKTWKEV